MAAKTAGTWMSTDKVGYGNFEVVGTTLLYPLGTRVKVKDVGSTAYGDAEMIYVEGCASVVRGDICTINDNYLIARLVGGATGACGLALGALVASNYGWLQILGRGVATSNTTIVDGTQAYACGTAGMLDDAVLAGDAIAGMIISSTTDTATCIVNMTINPFLSDMNAT